MEEMQYELLWRNKFLTTEAESIEDMIETLQSAVNDLRAMKEDGVVLSHGQEDDYATFVTDNKEIADKYSFETPFNDDDDEDFDDEDED